MNTWIQGLWDLEMESLCVEFRKECCEGSEGVWPSPMSEGSYMKHPVVMLQNEMEMHFPELINKLLK